MNDSALTVIIPSWNRRELLRNCLVSLGKQTVPVKILVVDNGSEDGTAEMVQKEFSDICCLRQRRNLGFARAVNIGIRAADTPFLALLNNDTEVAAGWALAGLEAFSEYPDYDFFASRMLQFHDRRLLDSAGDCYDRFGLPTKRGYGKAATLFNRVEPVLGASAGAAFYRRQVFDDVGLFDEDFHIYLEDVEFSLRCQLMARRCLYLPEARVYHMEAASDPSLPTDRPSHSSQPLYSPNRVFWITRNRFLLMLLYQPLRHLPFLVFGWVKSFGFHLLKAGFWGSFLKGLAAGIMLTPQSLRKRSELHQRKRISRKELCRLTHQC